MKVTALFPLILLFLTAFNTASIAQCKAGEILDSTKYVENTEILRARYGGFTPEKIDIKINKNSTEADITIKLDTFPLYCGSQNAKGTKIMIKNKTNVEILAGNLNLPEKFYFRRSRSLNYLDSINTNSNNNNQSYSWSSDSVLIAQSREIKADCSSGAIWDFNEFVDEPKFIGLRFKEGNEYKYSWIQINAFSSFDSARAIIKRYYSEELFTSHTGDTLSLSPQVKINKILDDGIQLQLIGMNGQHLKTTFLNFNGSSLQNYDPTIESDNAVITIPIPVPRSQQLYILSFKSEKINTTLKFIY